MGRGYWRMPGEGRNWTPAHMAAYERETDLQEREMEGEEIPEAEAEDAVAAMADADEEAS